MENEKKCQETMDLQYDNGDAIGWALTEALCFAFEKWTLEEFNLEIKKWLDNGINPC